jgi:mannose-1-phosphate guanylyltransferase
MPGMERELSRGRSVATEGGSRRGGGETRAPWAIVLAAGQGRRLESLTTDRAGRTTPKQYCSLNGARTLLDEALERALALTVPERTLVVVAREHRPHWERLLDRIPAANVLAQPRDRGTAAGLLLPLHTIVARDPRAVVVSLPADHHVERERVLHSALRRAVDECRHDRHRVACLGIAPDGPETEYGWILPQRGNWIVRGVERFVEKPPAALARGLMAREAVWNSFILAGAADAFLGLVRRRAPALAAAFESAFHPARPSSAASLERLYAAIESTDLSRHVLEGSEPFLRVLLVPPCGWTDLGTPRRVAECLARAGACAPVSDVGREGPLRLDLALASV